MREKQPSQEQLMADLPADRIRPGRAFETSGVDYAGPFQIKYLDKDKSVIQYVKGWTAVFVCMKTRAKKKTKEQNILMSFLISVQIISSPVTNVLSLEEVAAIKCSATTVRPL